MDLLYERCAGLDVHPRSVSACARNVKLTEVISNVLGMSGRAILRAIIDGNSEVTARVILAEIGDDMSRFPTSGHLISWAGLCPRLDESAGKKRSTRVRRGAPWLKTVLVQAARAAANKHDSYHRAQYLRIKARRGPNKAVLAVAASMLTAAYHMLKYGVEYRDLGPLHFEHDKQVQVARLLHRLKGLGVDVTVKPAA